MTNFTHTVTVREHKLSGGMLVLEWLATITATFSDGGPLLAAKIGPRGPVLFAKSGHGGQFYSPKVDVGSSFSCQK